jgi:tetratricopeptide (TPR) repeat protein
VQQIASADTAARRSPRDPALVGGLGMTYHANLFYQEALAAYDEAAHLDPSNWRWKYYSALVHLERGDAPLANDALRAVVASQPGFGLASWRLGESAFKLARFGEAEAAYQRAASFPVTRPEEADFVPLAQVGQARVALNRGDRRTAITILEKVSTEWPRVGAVHRVLADAYRADGRLADADRHALRASTLRAYAAPHDPLVEALADQSRSSVFLLRHAASHDLRQASARREQLVRRAVEVDPENPDVLSELASLLQQLGRPADAVPYLTQHLKMVPGDQQSLIQLGKCYSDLGRFGEAERTLRDALAAADDAVGYYNLGLVLEQGDRLQEAESNYRRAISLGPGLASARNNLGLLLARTARMNEAEVQLREAIRLEPSSPDAYSNLSVVLLERRNLVEAEQVALKAIEVDPTHADAHANLGVIRANAGDLEAARRHFADALRLDPHHETARRNLTAIENRENKE